MHSQIRHPSLSPPNGFKLGIQQNSQEETYFKFHSEDIFREIYNINLKLNFVKNFAEGIEKLKKRYIILTLSSDKFLYHDQEDKNVYKWQSRLQVPREI